MGDSHVSGLDDSEEYGDSKLVDRLSELPDPLILEILSFLTTRDVVTTTLLSKRWENLWTTVPALDFRIPPFNGLHEFRSFVVPVLARWRGAKIWKFSLIFMTELPTSYLDPLLQFVIEKQVEELYIELKRIDFFWQSMANYSAPQCLYSCSSITKLTLVSFTMNIVETVRWSQLKSLSIHDADVSIEDAMSHILSGCPRLEVLNLFLRETGSGRNMIIESSSLKMLMIDMYAAHCSDNVSTLRIWAPNLESLEIYGFSYTEQAMSQILSDSPQLEVLNLCIRETGENLNIVSSSLKMLVIDMYLGRHNEWKGAVLRIWAPNLESLEIRGVSYSMCLLNVPCLNNAVLGFDERDCFMLLEEMLWQLLLSICHVRKLELTDWCIKKKDMVVKFSDAKFLKLYPGKADGILDVLEIFPELRMLVIQHNEIISLFKEEEEEEPCIAMEEAILPNHSLLHLKTVEITWHLRDASIIPVIKVLLENAPVLEKMVLRLRTHGADPEMFVVVEEKMLSMPRSSPNVEVIIRQVC